MHETPIDIKGTTIDLPFISRAMGGFVGGADYQSAATAASLPGRSRKREI